MATIKITDEELQKSANLIKNQLLTLPVIGASSTLKHMRGLKGIRGRQTLGQLEGDLEYGPYSNSREDKTEIKIKPRTLETFLGSVIKPFDPNEVWNTIYGSINAQGESLKNVPITNQILMFLTMQLGKNLNKAIWNSKRNDSGTKSSELFNGFDTITNDEITGNEISADKGNYKVIQAITNENAVDILKDIYESSNEILRDSETKFYIPKSVYDKYVKDYQSSVGAVPYNKEYQKTFLEGSNDMCQLVPLSSKKGSPFLHLTTQNNMTYGYGGGEEGEKIQVDRFSPFNLTFSSTIYFGTQFESISSERLMVASIDNKTSI